MPAPPACPAARALDLAPALDLLQRERFTEALDYVRSGPPRDRTLIKREEPSRLLLFGGGFNRAALAALCEQALRDCGGRP
jgi:hypothetical protein